MCDWVVGLGLFSRDAVDKIRNSALERVVVLNTIPIPPHKHIDKITQLSIGFLLAQTIDRVQTNSSVSNLFKPLDSAASAASPAAAATPAAATQAAAAATARPVKAQS